VALGRLGREHVDVGEDPLGEQVERVGIEARPDADGREPPPRDARADPVGGEQRVQAAACPHLALAERAVHVRTPNRPARLDLGEQVAERRLHAGDDADPEVALDRPRVARDVGDDRLNHLLGGLIEDRAEHLDDRRIELIPRMAVELCGFCISLPGHVMSTIGENCAVRYVSCPVWIPT
jgi:hypothetical protein